MMNLTISNMLRSLILGSILCQQGVAISAPTKEFIYRPDEIYPIATGVGIATQIEIDPKEVVKDFGTGFSSGWDLVRRDNVFYLKPKDLQSDTNMYVRTDRRVYLFDLKIVTKDWKNLEAAKSAGVNYKISFVYPADVKKAKQTDGVIRLPLGNREAAVGPGDKGELNTQLSGYEKYNMNYDYSAGADSKWLVPVRIYDDGYFTYIDFPKLTSFPAVYARKSKDVNTEMLLNTTVENNKLVVHGIHPYLVLRHGDSVVGIRRNNK